MNIKPITPRHIFEAVEILREGGIVAFPTETVYGLGARADDEAAVAKIFCAKGRPNFNPLIAHMADIEMARNYVDFHPLALKIATHFWPGALSLVLPLRSENIAGNVTAGLETLAIRVPAHPVFRELIAGLKLPISAPSANLSGRLSPTTAQAVAHDLHDKVDLILDAGTTQYGLESTIIEVNGDEVTLLRHGAIPQEEIEEFLGFSIQSYIQSNTPKSPGQLLKHYAPRTKIVLNSKADMANAGDFWVGFGDQSEYDLSPKRDLAEAAHRLFETLFLLDQKASLDSTIYIAPIPNIGIGVAINDRLERASSSVSS